MQDFGVWNISYAIVACEPNWAGAQNSSALGAATNFGPEAVCCPANVTVSIVGAIEINCPDLPIGQFKCYLFVILRRSRYIVRVFLNNMSMYLLL
jgi:hypothetical protein